jgi:predicted P-loop ATPase
VIGAQHRHGPSYRAAVEYAQQHPEEVAAEIAADWRYSLILNKDGGPRALLANALTALRHAPEWDGVLAFNEFSLGILTLKPAPWDGAPARTEWTDNDDRLAANWLQEQDIFVSVEIAGQAVQSVAKERPFHPVREYLESVKWDGAKRIDAWLGRYLGAEQNDYTAAVGARWLISAVARIYQPGAKADCCLILEGPQGLKKSTALRTIADPWFTDEIADLGSKDAAMQTRGVWVIEIAELDSMTRGEVSKIKAFMSRSTDRFRPPYGRRLVESPRQCVFAGSINLETWNRDETGARRFWPVACTHILIDDLARDRNQLWAEAVAQYRGGSPWWLDSVKLNKQAEQEQANRYEGDPWDDLIAPWVEQPSDRYDSTGHPLQPFTSTRDSVTVVDVLNHCIGKRQDQWTQADKNRVARSLRALGWARYRERSGKDLEWRYRRK